MSFLRPFVSSQEATYSSSSCLHVRNSDDLRNVMLLQGTVGRVFFPKTSVAIVILFWLKWAGYLAVAGLNLLAQLSDRISPYGV